ncbi:SigE family RNA polymerase sigma factor [Planotetraspora sp. GP83]|uniref:SigE family RNA polymerase sigma factor n=1 Tax=Planotetraspora sp. GP83 TaxID=3156264 RepID=UPI00351359C0
MEVLIVERGWALKRHAVLLCGNESEAEDLVQDACVRVLGRPLTSGDVSQLEQYVRKTMVNLAIDRHRRLSLWRKAIPKLSSQGEVPDPSIDIAVTQDLRTALQQLSPRQRACVVLRYYDDLAVGQIAAVLGCGEGTVKRHLSEGLARLGLVYRSSGKDASCPSTHEN